MCDTIICNKSDSREEKVASRDQKNMLVHAFQGLHFDLKPVVFTANGSLTRNPPDFSFVWSGLNVLKLDLCTDRLHAFSANPRGTSLRCRVGNQGEGLQRSYVRTYYHTAYCTIHTLSKVSIERNIDDNRYVDPSHVTRVHN